MALGKTNINLAPISLTILLQKELHMSIDVTCPGCAKAYSVPDERAGQRFKCKACGTAVSVPADEWSYDSGKPTFGTSAGGFQDSYNPYAEPVSASNGGPRTGRTEALSKVGICAIFLYIVAGISIPLHLLNAVVTIVDRDEVGGAGFQAPANEAERAGRLVGALGASVAMIAMNTIVIVGAYNLHYLKKRWMALTAAIICCIPCCSPCVILGIPFGIWALVLLNSPEIKPHFEG